MTPAFSGNPKASGHGGAKDGDRTGESMVQLWFKPVTVAKHGKNHDLVIIMAANHG